MDNNQSLGYKTYLQLGGLGVSDALGLIAIASAQTALESGAALSATAALGVSAGALSLPLTLGLAAAGLGAAYLSNTGDAGAIGAYAGLVDTLTPLSSTTGLLLTPVSLTIGSWLADNNSQFSFEPGFVLRDASSPLIDGAVGILTSTSPLEVTLNLAAAVLASPGAADAVENTNNLFTSNSVSTQGSSETGNSYDTTNGANSSGAIDPGIVSPGQGELQDYNPQSTFSMPAALDPTYSAPSSQGYLGYGDPLAASPPAPTTGLQNEPGNTDYFNSDPMAGVITVGPGDKPNWKETP